jgi:transcriptional regulator with XRE-family HTH domain
MFNQKYFRYLLKKKGIKTRDIASLVNLSHTQFNYCVRNESLKLRQIEKILKILDLPYEEVFKFEKM